MSGAIMPEPLAMPLILTSIPSILATAVAPFGKVSVVMIARAADSHNSGRASRTMSPTSAVNFSTGSGSPITPVEASSTSSAAQPRASATDSTESPTARGRAFPVNAFAFPELTRTAPEPCRAVAPIGTNQPAPTDSAIASRPLRP